MSPATRRDLAVLLLVCALVFWWRLGRLGLIDPDEPFYAQTAAEMLGRHDLVTPYIFGHPQFEKPPLFYWLVSASFTALGRSEFAARVPGALFGTLLVLMTWAFGRSVFGPRSGLLAGLVLASGMAYAITARMVLTDTVFATAVCASCFAFWRAAGGDRPRPGWFVAAAAASAVAALVKGPLGTLVPALAGLLWLRLARRSVPARGGTLLAAAAVYLAIAAPWYAAMFSKYGMGYFRAFFIHENLDRLLHAEHPSNNTLYYYPAVLLLGSWPWIPAIAVTLMRWLPMLRRRARPGGHHVERGPAADPVPGSAVAGYLMSWIATSLVFFTIAASKLPTYILFLFVPLALLAGASLDGLLRDGFRSRTERAVALALAALQSLGLLAIFAVHDYRDLYPPVLAAAFCLLVALVLLWRRPSAAWVAATTAGMAAFIVGLTGWSAQGLEAVISVRPAIAVLESEGPRDTPVLASKLLVRGVRYYADRGESVLSNKSQPFFTPHALPIVVGADGLDQFVRQHGATLCVMGAREWHSFERRLPAELRVHRRAVGDKLVIRVETADGPGPR